MDMNRIISLITVFHPTQKHAENIARMAKQSDLTVVCDNSEDRHEELFCFPNENVVYVPNDDNLGLSQAFNKVLKDKERFSWAPDDVIVFFDQDSVIEEGHIAGLVRELEELTGKGHRVGCLGPVFYNNSNRKVEMPRMYKRLTETAISVDSIMTSSMICAYSALEDIGFWNEEVFLDMADWDICWRMKKSGRISVMTTAVMLNHTVGEGERKIGPLSLRIAKPFREYYETRDCMYLLKKKYVPLKDRIRFHLMLTVRPLLHLWFLENKEERKYYIKLGVRHYRMGRTGKLTEEDRWKGKDR